MGHTPVQSNLLRFFPWTTLSHHFQNSVTCPSLSQSLEKWSGMTLRSVRSRPGARDGIPHPAMETLVKLGFCWNYIEIKETTRLAAIKLIVYFSHISRARSLILSIQPPEGIRTGTYEILLAFHDGSVWIVHRGIRKISTFKMLQVLFSTGRERICKYGEG